MEMSLSLNKILQAYMIESYSGQGDDETCIDSSTWRDDADDVTDLFARSKDEPEYNLKFTNGSSWACCCEKESKVPCQIRDATNKKGTSFWSKGPRCRVLLPEGDNTFQL